MAHSDQDGSSGLANGNHAGDGLSVAELIAKVGGTTKPRRRHRAAPETESTAFVEPPPYRSELPDLDQLHVEAAHAEQQTTTQHTKSRRFLKLRLSVPARRPTLHPPHIRHPMLLAGRTVAALMAAFALVLTGGAWQWSTSKNNSLNRVNALDRDSRDIVDPNGQYGDENFLIVGTDNRAGANSGIGAGDVDDAEGSRSDSIMLVNIPASRKRVVVVSFPRDMAISPLYCQAWDSNTGRYGPVYDPKAGEYSDDMRYTGTKLNSAYAYGGPKCLVKAVQKLSGLSVSRFMAVDFVGFDKMVDELGGVEVCSTTPLYDEELGTILNSSGRQTIDGSTALNYVRARSVTTEDNGDYGRIKRQQLFLSSLLRSLISKETFFSLTKLNNVVNTFISDSFVDNIQTRDLVNLGQSLQGISAGHITFLTVPTAETDENGDEPPRKADMRALFNAIIDDDPLPGENDQNATTTPTTEVTATTTQNNNAEQRPAGQVDAVTTVPYRVTVQVSNATGQAGLAGSVSDKLELQGFNTRTPDDYPDTVKATTVLFSPGNEEAAATVASALGNPAIERTVGLRHVVQVVLGSDFHSVTTPAESGSPVSLQLTRGVSTASTRLPDDLTFTNGADVSCE